MSAKHTPGPWGTHYHPAHGHCITRVNEYGNPKPFDIAVVFAAGDGRTGEQCKADARVIATAPDLLEAAAAVAAFIGGVKDRLGRPDPCGSDAMRAARQQVLELATRYGVQGGHHTYIDQCAALLNAVVAKATQP